MKIQVNSGTNVIRIVFNAFASCLVIKKALVVNWPDCRGSIGQYYALAEYSSAERQQLTRELNQVLTAGDEPGIEQAMNDFLKLFPDGGYEIRFIELPVKTSSFFYEFQIEYSKHVPANERFTGAFYPYPYENLNYFFTIPAHSLDQDRVNAYCDLIQKGERPKIIIHESVHAPTSDYSSCYILDGHHKTEAYIRCGIDIPAVHILRYQDRVDRASEILDAARPLLKDFEYEHLARHIPGSEV